MSPIELTKICTAYCSELHVKKDFETWDKNPIPYSEHESLKVLSLLFSTYPKNVPEPEVYTVEDMVNLANDPTLIDLYEEPFCILNLYHLNRPALYVTPHAGCDLDSYLEQPSEMDNTTVVIRAHGEVKVLDLKEVIAKCALPDKYVYGCIKCLGTQVPIDGACPIRHALGANNPYYIQEATSYSGSTLHLHDFRRVKTYGRYQSPFKSKRTQIAGHLYVSPVMFYEDTSQKYKRRDVAFTGLRSIGSDNINFDMYEEHLERKTEAADTRKKYFTNAKTHCPNCSVQETCHRRFAHKKKFCTEPLPPSKEIDAYFMQQENSVSKPLLVDILLASGRQIVTNPSSGRKVDAYVGVHNNYTGMGYRVMSRTKGNILCYGTTLEEWEKFKKDNEIDVTYSDIARKELTERLNNPAAFAKLLACASIRESPRLVSAFHSTTYDKAYIEAIYGKFVLKFRYPSKRGICPWSYEIADWDDLFAHYGRIPGFR
jgi:hypothetical protein